MVDISTIEIEWGGRQEDKFFPRTMNKFLEEWVSLRVRIFELMTFIDEDILDFIISFFANDFFDAINGSDFNIDTIFVQNIFSVFLKFGRAKNQSFT